MHFREGSALVIDLLPIAQRPLRGVHFLQGSEYSERAAEFATFSFSELPSLCHTRFAGTRFQVPEIQGTRANQVGKCRALPPRWEPSTPDQPRAGLMTFVDSLRAMRRKLAHTLRMVEPPASPARRDFFSSHRAATAAGRDASGGRALFACQPSLGIVSDSRNHGSPA